MADYILLLDFNETMYVMNNFDWQKNYVVQTGFKTVNREGIRLKLMLQ